MVPALKSRAKLTRSLPRPEKMWLRYFFKDHKFVGPFLSLPAVSVLAALHTLARSRQVDKSSNDRRQSDLSASSTFYESVHPFDNCSRRLHKIRVIAPYADSPSSRAT